MIIEVGPNCYALKIHNLSFNEEYKCQFLIERDKVMLIGIYGDSKEFDRLRYLGTILLFIGEPLVHSYPLYVVVAYSDPTDVRRKEPKLIYSDEFVRFLRAGIGSFDYMLCYRNRRPFHDEIGQSDGAAYKQALDVWKL